MISRFVGSSPTSGFVLTAWSLLGILSLSLSLPFPSALCVLTLTQKLALSQEINIKKKKMRTSKAFTAPGMVPLEEGVGWMIVGKVNERAEVINSVLGCPQ